MDELKLTGGARIGMFNATFPFATLKVNNETLELNASIIGNLTFQLCDIRSIEPYTLIPIIGQGIKINHSVSTYNKEVVFLTFKDPKTVIKQIQKAGFYSKKDYDNQTVNNTIVEKQAMGGFPVRKKFAIGAVVIWNLLFLTDLVSIFMEQVKELPIGKGALTAVGLLFVMALMSLISANFRRVILKEGRKLEDIKKLTILILIISGFILLNFGIMTNFLK